MGGAPMTDRERIKLLEKRIQRLEEVLGNFIAWDSFLGLNNQQELLNRLNDPIKLKTGGA